MNGQENKLLEDFRCETSLRLDNVEKTVESIKTNDLPHLDSKISDVKGQMKVLIPLVVSTFVAVLGMIILFVMG